MVFIKLSQIKTFCHIAVFAGVLAVCSAASAGTSPLNVAGITPTNTPAGANTPFSELSEPQKLSLSNVKGEVLYKKSGDTAYQPAKAGVSLEMGDSVKTGKGTCEIIFDDKTQLSIAPRTEITINESLKDNAKNIRSTVLSMGLGKLKAHVTKVTPGSRFEILTPSAVAAVRGTVLFLNSGNMNTNLYVDETESGVQFTHTESGDSSFVSEFSESDASGNGNVTEPRMLSEEERQARIQQWENQLANYNSDGSSGNEENEGESNEDGSGDEDNSDDKANDTLKDALIDKLSEQNVSGGAVQDKIEEILENHDQIDPAELERLLISKEIARIRRDQDFQHADANLARISDAQTGKVMTDVHGNRVRVDQYVFHEQGSPTAQFLSLTLRTGAYQNGVSAVLFGVDFNAPITGFLRDLPWNDYLNVVTNDELQAANIGTYEQFVVHQSYGTYASQGPSFYPLRFFADFTNPDAGRGGRDMVSFEEIYSDPFKLTGSPQGNFWVQGRDAEAMLIYQFQGDTILSASFVTAKGNLEVLEINGVPQIPDYSDNGGDGSQTANFASLFNASKLMPPNAVNYYRNLPQNSNGDPNDDEHPAYFEENFGNKVLIGVFVPINDAGQVFDVPGFRLHGMRDLVAPNPLVNGGDYNLEVILFYGSADVLGNFSEAFRIDTIIAPEILAGMGTINHSAIFPASLQPDNDDYYDEGGYAV